MLSHALTIVLNELTDHFAVYNGAENSENADAEENSGEPGTQVVLGNLSEGVGSAPSVPRNALVLSVVNIKEEKTLKNLPNSVRNETTLTTVYENPPVFLNFLILITATHGAYTDALTILSRAIRFFQHTNVFTQDTVKTSSLKPPDIYLNPLDELDSFKLIFDLYSPSLEEVNHLWGTLGGKQYPFVLYVMRMLDLKFKAIQSESGLITEVVRDVRHKQAMNEDG